MNPIRFEIVILTYKRPQLLKECLESWLTQELSHTKIVVSDNSPDDLTKNLLESELTSAQKELFDYRKMNPPVDSLSHFEFCRQNVSADWYMLFHDDDVVVPNAWAKLKTTILEMHENEITRCSAIACSADILRSSGERHIIEKRKSLGPLKINSATEFIKHYCWPESSHPMFPVYLYQKQLVALIPFDNSSAGKYSDTTYLIRLLGQGYLLWLPIKLMLYRVHGSNDSSTHSLKDSLSLLNFVVKTDSKFYRSRDYQFLGEQPLWLLKEIKDAAREAREPRRERSPRADLPPPLPPSTATAQTPSPRWGIALPTVHAAAMPVRPGPTREAAGTPRSRRQLARVKPPPIAGSMPPRQAEAANEAELGPVDELPTQA